MSEGIIFVADMVKRGALTISESSIINNRMNTSMASLFQIIDEVNRLEKEFEEEANKYDFLTEQQ